MELQRKQIIVLPILIEECEIPVFLMDRFYADFTGEYNEALQEFLNRLQVESKEQDKSILHKYIARRLHKHTVRRKTLVIPSESSIATQEMLMCSLNMGCFIILILAAIFAGRWGLIGNKTIEALFMWTGYILAGIVVATLIAVIILIKIIDKS